MSRKTLIARSARVFSPAVLMLLPLLLGASSTGEPESVIEIGLTRAFETELRRSPEGIPIRKLRDGIRVRVSEGEATDLVLLAVLIEGGRTVAEHTSDEFECFPKEWKMIPLDDAHLHPQTDVFLTPDRVLTGALVDADLAHPARSQLKTLIPALDGSSKDADGLYIVALPAESELRSSARVRPMYFHFGVVRIRTGRGGLSDSPR